MKNITPCLWFDNKAEEAINFYVSIFEDSRILNVARYGKEGSIASGQSEGSIMTITFQLKGQNYLALNGGPVFNFTPAVSFVVNCESQQEVDYYWDKLTEGGEVVECGWLNDKYGLSWQIVPIILDEMMLDKNPKKAEAAMKAMLQMKKLDIAELKRAYEGASAN